MTSLVHGPTTTAPHPVGSGTVAVLAGLTALSLAPYLAGVLLPYYVNDLDALPLAEVSSGRHDPKDLWPQGPVGGLVQAAGFFSLALTPMGLLAALCGALYALSPTRRRTTRAVTAALVLVTLVCLGVFALFVSPLGSTLISWRMD